MNEPIRAELLRAQGLTFSYPGQPALLTDWSVVVAAGVTLLHGDTGSGKSTLLRLIAGELPVAGRLTLVGVRLREDPQAYRRQVFHCDAATDAYDAVTARDCTAALCAGDTGFDGALWQSLVEGFALAPHIEKPVYMLSTGSKRKLWLAAALAAGRALTLLDEPTAALDAASVRHLWSALGAAAASSGRAVIVASAERIDRVPLVGSIELPPR
jgi:ABC-2 type transport system ATP-binding protein